MLGIIGGAKIQDKMPFIHKLRKIPNTKLFIAGGLAKHYEEYYDNVMVMKHGKGNYNFGVKEQIIFTEINYDNIQSVRGLNITIATTAKTDDEAYELLKSFGFPLKEKPVKNNVEEAA